MQRRTFLSSTLVGATSAWIGCGSSDDSDTTASTTAGGTSAASGGGATGAAAQGSSQGGAGAAATSTGQGGASQGGASPIVWDIGAPTFVEGGGSTFDLAPTLPNGVVPGGTFEVDGSGAPLPSGMSLSAGGVLTLGAAMASVTAGVVFRYTEP
jgi:hypothetical protein